MSDRVVEILIYIMSEIRRNRKVSKQLDTLSKSLVQKGYSEGEISSALTWLIDRLNNDSGEIVEKQNASSKNSFRQMHEIERSVISVDAYGYMIQLRELGIIDELDFEQIIERAFMLGTPDVGIEDIKSIVASLLFASENLGDGSYFLLDDNPVIH